MDEETRGYFDRMDLKFTSLETVLARMMGQINNKFEQLIDSNTRMSADLQNLKGFLLEDAVQMGSRVQSVEERLTRLEREVELLRKG